MKIIRFLFVAIATLLCSVSVNAENIEFADAKVKELCVANWDTNGDGEFSYVEASSVTDIGGVFEGDTTIIKFEELQYFSSLTKIADKAFSGCSRLLSISIPDNVSILGEKAFFECASLSRIDFKNAVDIKDYCFTNCVNLKQIVLWHGAVNIASSAFTYCSNLESIVFNSNDKYRGDGYSTGIVERETNTLVVGCKNGYINSGLSKLGDFLFAGYQNIGDVEIPEGIIEIGDYVLSVSSVASVKIPTTLKKIGNHSFEFLFGNQGADFKKVFISDMSAWLNIEYEDGYGYSNPLNYAHDLYLSDSLLTEIIIPDDITELKAGSLLGWHGRKLTIHNKINNISESALSCRKLDTIIVESVKPIELKAGTYLGTKNILYVPKGSKSAYEAAEVWKEFKEIVEYDKNIKFADAKVKELCVANWDTNGDGELSTAEAAAVSDLGEVFKQNEDITSFNELQYFTGLKSIGKDAFYECSGLTSVTIPYGVTSIGWGAFAWCSGLTSITIPNSVTSIDDWVFDACFSLTSIIIPNSVTKFGKYVTNYSGLNSIIVEDGNPIYDSRDNCNAIIETATNTLHAGCKNTIIPNSVKSIGDEAFAWCYGLTSITIPNSVTSIGALAFYCSADLTSITIPNSVTSIGQRAFAGCSLTSITIPNRVASIGKEAFVSCSLTSIIVEDGNRIYDSRDNCNAIIETATNTLLTGGKNTVIPNSVTSIGGSAFSHCDELTSITIPNSVTSIGGSAFSGCDDLTSITIPNSVTSIGGSAFNWCRNLTSVTVINKTPITLSSGDTFYNRANATLYVPSGSKAAYEAADVWKEFKEIVEMEPTELTLTLNQYGKSTYCSEYALDFTNVEGLKAYVATGYNTRTGVVTMTRVMTTKGGTGLFLKGEQGSYQVPIIAESDDNTLNLLVGTLAKVTVNSKDDTYTNYKFTVKEGETEPGFYNFADNSTLSANKAYLRIPTAWLPSTSDAKSVRMWFEDEEATGIDEINTNRPDSDTIYDMQGRRVKNPSKGMYIVNGKKMIIK